jgi:hypothetical protein
MSPTGPVPRPLPEKLNWRPVEVAPVSIPQPLPVSRPSASGTWSVSATLGVAQGGTGAATFTSNGVLYGNGAGAIQATAAGTSAQFLVANGSGVPVFVSMSSDVLITNAGVATIQANAVALGTDTTGNYVATVSTSALTGITGGAAGSEGTAITLASITQRPSQRTQPSRPAMPSSVPLASSSKERQPIPSKDSSP